MKICEIKRVKRQNEIHKTIYFSHPACREARAGQFVMVWIPGLDEIPMSLSEVGSEQAITVEKVGEATRALHEMVEGDKIGIRGPYGNGFTMVGKKALFVGGGTGIAPMLPLIKRYGGEKYVVLGAQKKDFLLFVEEIERMAHLYISTDDGSAGYKGFATDLAKSIMEEEEFDIVYTCGPEPMMKKMLDMCLKKGVPMQASLERYMKCGVGICDSCSINGYHVCKDGPVFDSITLARLEDFGKWKRNEAGVKVSLSQ